VPLRIVMMGTGEFALPALRGLLDSPHAIVGLVTQPDRTGRGHHHHVNPLKELALGRGAPVFQPEKASSPESLEQLRAFEADLFVVAAYGQILSTKLLQTPRYGAINLHGSLLPRYRGAAPIQYAVWNGESRTGVTIFQVVRELDAGPVLGMVETEIGPTETSGELHDRLADLAVPLTLAVIDDIEHGRANPVAQDAGQATFAPRIPKEAGAIDWSQSAEQIGWHVRAMQPWPMPFTFLHRPGSPPLRILLPAVGPALPAASDVAPGAVVASPPGRLFVATANGVLEILCIQPSGKRVMETSEFLRGHPLGEDARFGPE
jgi:methionyl-tRNA formyltransferase